MVNQWKMVPSEPTEEMNKAGMRWLSGIQHMRAGDKRNALNEAFKAMTDSAPVPPAGDVEVRDAFCAAYRELHGYAPLRVEGTNEYKVFTAGFDSRTAHLTRLTAERDGFKASAKTWQESADSHHLKLVHIQIERDGLLAEVKRLELHSHCHLQRAKIAESELTKARELLHRAHRYKLTVEEHEQIEAYLAHQSAPAAKCNICNGTGVVGDASIGYDQCFHNAAPAAKGGE